ncbi:MAG: hypothetical protein H6Q99_892 [Proteobacteria bacterium]|nr:hypothetical protein [Pseudomonadota bacterium]
MPECPRPAETGGNDEKPGQLSAHSQQFGQIWDHMK